MYVNDQKTLRSYKYRSRLNKDLTPVKWKYDIVSEYIHKDYEMQRFVCDTCEELNNNNTD